MKIEMWYDPITPMTTVRIDGKMQSNRDIYGFLYPVRRYLLQTWLEPNGSWNGLKHRLHDLAYGQPVEIHFHGREADGADLRQTLHDAEDIRVTCSLWDATEALGDKLRQAEKLVSGVKIPGEDGARVTAEIRRIMEMEPAWKTTVSSAATLSAAIRSRAAVCEVTPDYLTDFSGLETLTRLTASLRRPADAIVCMAASEEHLAELRRYAGQFSKLRFRFALAEDKTELTKAEKKYGEPCALRQELEKYREILLLLRRYEERQQGISRRRMELVQRRSARTITPQEQEEFSQLQQIAGFLDKDVAPRLAALLDAPLTPEPLP